MAICSNQALAEYFCTSTGPGGAAADEAAGLTKAPASSGCNRHGLRAAMQSQMAVQMRACWRLLEKVA